MKNKLVENLKKNHNLFNKDVYYGETLCHSCKKEVINYCVWSLGWFVCEKCAIFLKFDGYRVER